MKFQCLRQKQFAEVIEDVIDFEIASTRCMYANLWIVAADKTEGLSMCLSFN